MAGEAGAAEQVLCCWSASKSLGAHCSLLRAVLTLAATHSSEITGYESQVHGELHLGYFQGKAMPAPSHSAM